MPVLARLAGIRAKRAMEGVDAEIEEATPAGISPSQASAREQPTATTAGRAAGVVANRAGGEPAYGNAATGATMVDAAAGRILVVDDDASACRALARLLRSFGFGVTTFGSAAEVLAAGPPDDALCLVADVRMPGMGGVELCERLRASGRDIPTVFVTAHGTERLRSPVLQGAPVLQKPVDAEHLVAAIDFACRRSPGARRGDRPPGS
jgi:CheY-like chemotaxis protein